MIKYLLTITVDKTDLAHNMPILISRIVKKLENPRILNITFKSFRHFGGLWLAYITEGNVLAVKKALRHKTSRKHNEIHPQNRLSRPTKLRRSNRHKVEEIKHLAEAGFQKFNEFNGTHVFRRPKRFLS